MRQINDKHGENMKLITKAIEKKLPAFYATEEVALQEKNLVVKFFTPDAQWTWYGVEYDKKSETFFGYAIGNTYCGDFAGGGEWGYFSIDELKKAKGQFGLGVERDMSFRETKFKNLKEA